MRMSTVGILGAGQLGRMLALAGLPLGLHFRFMDPFAESPASRIAPFIPADFSDPVALRRFAEGLSVATYEFENVPVRAARQLEQFVPVHPAPIALDKSQDRLAEKTFFASLGVPTAEYAEVSTRAQLEAALSRIGLPAVLKTRRLGYDGKGQFVLRSMTDIDPALKTLTGDMIVEGLVHFERELSIIGVRNQAGEIAFYPLIQNHHRDGILRQSVLAEETRPGLQRQAEEYARAVMSALGYVGILAIELFERNGELIASEMAPRVHNSGHWTIDGAVTSQFENHLRAICGLPLGSTQPLGRCAMINLIGRRPDPACILAIEGAHLHLYDKAPRPGRKLGHVTVVDQDEERLKAKVNKIMEHVDS